MPEDTIQLSEPKKRGRPREDYVPEKRRKRNDIDTVGKRLAVNPEQLDFTKFKYRWINADDARVWHMVNNSDWQLMHRDGTGIRDESVDLGTLWSCVVGKTPEGRGLHAYLARKRVEWYEEDQKQKQTELDEQLQQLRRGLDAAGGSQSDYVPGRDTPGEAIKIG